MTDLETIERRIRPLARRFSSNLNEIEDLEQIARITAWQMLEKDPEANENYILAAIKNDFLNQFAYDGRMKRRPQNGLTSLDANIGDDGCNLHDLVGEESPVETYEECMNGFIEGLRGIFGKNYLKGIKGNGGPYKEKVREITRAVIEEIHKIPKEDIPRRIDYRFFVQAGLEPFLWLFYQNSPFAAVTDAYPDEKIKWNFRKKPNGYWNGRKGYKRALEAIDWFCKSYGIESVDDCKNVSTKDFQEAGLSGMLQKHFNDSPYLALKTKHPELKVFQTNRTSNGFYNTLENQKKALDFYLSSKGFPNLNELTPEEVYELGLRVHVTSDDIDSSGLRGLHAKYSGNMYQMFSTLYPGKILPWTLHSSKEAWKDDPRETGAKSIRWLFDTYLEIPQQEIPNYATCDLFWRVGFSGILTNRSIGYSSSPFKAVESAYPGQYTREDFKRSRWNPCPKIKTKDLKKTRTK